ncbi:TonB-dependent receptor [Cesiribacter andamanensis]|uniref:Outer membrane cobalamin receptor protein n=1 Tax=Cesiribacter andamanensis AMV16 TaxID=1279009 RepID=M7N4L8_9BACT|nr:TonB-dependent receptor [Cesiribacter andamanensis]EMR03613.1 Outer membrane cobalamin receptor protein [Cesiribacter andamanensis AMV16]
MKPIFYLLFLFSSLAALAQPSLSGRVTDQQGQPLPGANVFLAGTFSGATTSGNGAFSFQAPEVGSYVLVVRFIGYREFKQPLELAATDSLWLPVQLREEPAQLGEVVITAGTFEASDVNRAASLTTQDVLTTAAALGDVIGAIQLLPGASPQAEDGRLFIRGGSADESRLYVNGLAVQNPYGATAQNLPSRGRFSPTMFQGFRFSTGGYSAEWGEALSAVLAMDHRNFQNTSQQTNLGLMSIGGSLAHQRKLGRGGIAAEVEYTNLAPYMALAPQRYQFPQAPYSWGGALVWQQPLGEGRLQLMLDSRRGGLHVSQPDITQPNGIMDIALQNQNHYGQLRWQQPLHKNWLLTNGLALSADETLLQPNGARLEQHSWLLHLKSKLEGELSRSLRLTLGAEVERPHLEEAYRESSSPLQQRSQQWWRSAGWAEADWQPLRKLALRAGLRSSHSSRTGAMALQPRFSAAWQLQREQQLSLAAGVYSQEPDTRWLRELPGLADAHSRHLVLNYQYQPEGRTLRAEAYYKTYEGLPLYTPDAEGKARLSTGGSGYARGAEIFWRDRKSLKRTDYWISYSYVDSRRQWADYLEAVTPPFALAHSLGMVYKYFIPGLRSQVGGSFSLHSGRPYENPNTEGFMNERAPLQQNLSLNWAFLWKQNLILYTAATNVLGGGDALSYRYAAEPGANGQFQEQAVGPSAKRFLFIGLFYTLSHDKQKNQLDQL